MPDAVKFVNLIKKAALDAVKASKPVEIQYGKVLSVKPIKITIEQKLNLNQNQLVITKTASNAKKGDKVVLLRTQGGQKYIVLDVIL